MDMDVLIFGGGIAGIWTLDELTRRGYDAALLETKSLGSGQTISAQGIIHGGMKYALQGTLTASAANIRDMPNIWRECLAGERQPDLSAAQVRSEKCYLWQTDSLTSRLGMLGARIGLRTSPAQVAMDERPAALVDCPGNVAELPEQVIDPASVLDAFRQRHKDRLFQISGRSVSIEHETDGAITSISACPSDNGQQLTWQPKLAVFCAGSGNANLMRQLGFDQPPMQLRPLHMVLLRGNLPELNGHCVDGAKTRVTITSAKDRAGRTVWQVGGQIAEDGVRMSASRLFQRAADDLQEVLPSVDFRDVEISSHRVNRAERSTVGLKRPDTFQMIEEANWIAAWPTKLALAPLLAEQIAEIARKRIGEAQPVDHESSHSSTPCPEVAAPPWEQSLEWQPFIDFLDSETQQRHAA
ncbi:MAG: FAD-dependent oxidoreductase [Planctomycetaceae bacterium]|nr:FAD-dependent oxidoreductase [Planctomycetaceae bacterium]